MPDKIISTTFDLAVIAIVETLAANIAEINQSKVRVRSKKDILDVLDISIYHWTEIRNHKRHVTTKYDKEQSIISKLVTRFGVDPLYIERFPHYKQMLTADAFAEDAGKLEVRQGSAKMLQQAVNRLKEEIARLNAEIKKYKETIAYQEDMLETQRQLIKTLQKPATNPAIKATKK